MRKHLKVIRRKFTFSVRKNFYCMIRSRFDMKDKQSMKNEKLHRVTSFYYFFFSTLQLNRKKFFFCHSFTLLVFPSEWEIKLENDPCWTLFDFHLIFFLFFTCVWPIFKLYIENTKEEKFLGILIYFSSEWY